MTSAVKPITAGPDIDSEIQITFEDQQQINKFARLNALNDDLKQELKSKSNELQNLEDAIEEVFMFSDDQKRPILVGECFLYQDADESDKLLEELKNKINQDIKDIKDKKDAVLSQMSDLKALLYAKFGDHINLDEE